MKHLKFLTLGLALLAFACNTAYQPSVLEEAPSVGLSQADLDAQMLEMRKARSFAHEYYKQHNYAEAKDYFLKMFTLDQKGKYNADLTRLATCYTQLGNQDSARVVLEVATDKTPDSHYAHRTLGLLLKRMGDQSGALREFHICVDLKPEDWESHLEIKKSLRVRADEVGSIQAWNLVLERLDVLIDLRSDDPSYAKEKDQILVKFFEPEEVIESLRANHQAFPEDMKLTRKLASALVEYATAETYIEALPLLNALLADSEEILIYDLKAIALLGLEREKQAAEVLKAMIQLDPDERKLPARLASLYLDLDELGAAKVWAQRTKARFPNYGRGKMLMAFVYEAAVNKCSDRDISYDDKLVYAMAAAEYRKVKDPAFRVAAGQRYKALEQVLPTEEDHFFHPDKKIKDECYQWLLK
jgi:predicted Zn-dependent protease